MAETRIPLTDLPVWGQDKIIRTAWGLLEDDNAYAVEISDHLFKIRAHGFWCTLYRFARYVY